MMATLLDVSASNEISHLIPGGGGGGVTHHTTCYAPAFKKSVERGLFLDIRRRKASSTFLLKKGCFFPLYRHLGVLFRKVGFEGF